MTTHETQSRIFEDFRSRLQLHKRRLNLHGPKRDDETPEQYRRRLLELPVEREEIHEIIGYDA